MAATEYLANAQISRYFFTTYSQGSVSAFSTQFNTDWSTVLPGTVQALATTAAPTVAIVIIPNGPVVTLNPTDSIGYNYGTWTVVTAAQLAAKYTSSSV